MPGKVKKVDFTRRGKWLKLLFISFLVYFIVIFINQHSTIKNLEDRRREVQGEIHQTELLNAELKQRIELLQTDYTYIEGVIRRELGLVREGETIYVLPHWNQNN